MKLEVEKFSLDTQNPWLGGLVIFGVIVVAIAYIIHKKQNRDRKDAIPHKIKDVIDTL